MKNFFIKFKTWTSTHKITAIILGLVLVGGIYGITRLFTATTQMTQYVLAAAEKGTIIASVSGSGQVEASSQVDLKADSTGKITYIGVKPGQQVTKGKTLFALDARDAQKTVRNAETDLETAKLELEKFKQGPTNLDIQLLEAEISKAEKSKIDADKAIATAYKNLLNTSTVAVSSMSNDTRTPPTITGTYTGNQEAEIKIYVYGTQSGQYFSVSSNPSGIAEIAGTGIVSTTIPQPLGNSGLYIKFASANDVPPLEWTITLPNKTVASYATNLKAYQDALDAKEETIRNADLTIAENKQKIADLYQPDTLELRSKELTVRQKEDALLDAQSNLSNYYVAAPFAGTIASVTAHVGDTASGTLGTIITKQKIATISLNEVDIAKIKLGQKATLTFDALEDFTITGEVVEIDSISTTSQGVVNYKVKIAFDTDSDSIKPGMSVSASIITDMKQDVIAIPTSAVKTQGNMSYVEVVDGEIPPSTGLQDAVALAIPPTRIEIVTGLSSDESVEIISGLSEGDQYVARTITTSINTTSQSNSAPSLFGSGAGGARPSGGGFGGGGNFPR